MARGAPASLHAHRIPVIDIQPTGVAGDEDSARARLQARIDSIVLLLSRQKILEEVSRRQSPARAELVESLAHQQFVAELRNKLDLLPAADIAHLLEMLPPSKRQIVWEQVADGKAGDVLWEVAEGVASDLVRSTPDGRLVDICGSMDADGLAFIVRYLPDAVLDAVRSAIEPRTRSWLAEATAYPEDTIGRLMSREMVVIDVRASVRDTLKMLRRLASFPTQTDALFVVDERDRLVGAVPLPALLISAVRRPVTEIMATDVARFTPHEAAAGAALAFERYDLVSAPVVDGRGRLIGRITVDTLMDFVRTAAEEAALKRAGLGVDTDLFGPVWTGARQRWLWLAVNLLTAILASRVIGVFSDSIEKLVALATLMPIVASIGGNTGNQTVALFIRGLALDQITPRNLPYLAIKEVGISQISGVVWSGVMGLVAFALYRDVGLGAVMGVATLLNLVVAALAGIAVPVVMHHAGRYPAFGSSVLLTFTTDSMGFLIFLAMATAFLL